MKPTFVLFILCSVLARATTITVSNSPDWVPASDAQVAPIRAIYGLGLRDFSFSRKHAGVAIMLVDMKNDSPRVTFDHIKGPIYAGFQKSVKDSGITAGQPQDTPFGPLPGFCVLSPMMAKGTPLHSLSVFGVSKDRVYSVVAYFPANTTDTSITNPAYLDYMSRLSFSEVELPPANDSAHEMGRRIGYFIGRYGVIPAVIGLVGGGTAGLLFFLNRRKNKTA